ncbi:hypothetical protein ACFX13_013036 [Malus domestica]
MPCLDSHTVGCISQGTVPNPDSNHRFFIRVPSKTSNAYAMAWSISNLSYGDFFASIANGNTIIPSSNVCINNVDSR